MSNEFFSDNVTIQLFSFRTQLNEKRSLFVRVISLLLSFYFFCTCEVDSMRIGRIDIISLKGKYTRNSSVFLFFCIAVDYETVRTCLQEWAAGSCASSDIPCSLALKTRLALGTSRDPSPVEAAVAAVHAQPDREADFRFYPKISDARARLTFSGRPCLERRRRSRICAESRARRSQRTARKGESCSLRRGATFSLEAPFHIFFSFFSTHTYFIFFTLR